MTGRRILVVASPALGHLYPMVATLWALRAGGHDVRVAVPGYFARAVLHTGLPVLACAHPASEEAVYRPEEENAADSEDVRTLRRFARVAEAVGPELGEIVADWRPEIVLADQVDLAGRRAAAAAGVPYVEHRWGLALPEEPRLRAAADVFGAGSADWPGLGRPAALTVDPCPPSFQLPGAQPGQLTRYVPFNGPALVPRWLTRRPGGPRVLITFGTVLLEGAAESTVLADAVDAALAAGAEVVIAADRRTVPEAIAQRVRAVQWLPVALAAQHCDLVIHHGGSGTTLSALTRGVPQLACPFSLDELDNARRLTALGAGLAVPAAEADRAARLAEAVPELLRAQSYRQAAELLRAEIAAQPAPTETAQVIAALADRTGAAMPVTPGLSEDRVQRFRDNGFLFPVDVLSEAEAAELAEQARAHLRDSAAESDLLGALAYGPKIHLLRPWFRELVHHPRLLAVARSLLGPDVLVWGTNIFVKEPGGSTDLAWHQDALSYDLAGAQDRAFRVWLTLTPATPANGTLRFLAGTHRLGVLRHRRGNTAEELARGDEVCLEPAEHPAHEVMLRPGQCSLHNMLIVHGSGLNTTADTRISLAIDYLATSVRPAGDRPDSALLVSGQDRHGHFRPEGEGRAEFERAVALRFERIDSAMRAGTAAGLIVRGAAR